MTCRATEVSSGRLLTRGPWVVKRYFKGTQDATDDEQWFDTGDVAAIHPDGTLQITDRSKDVIKSGGEWISSIELENAAVGCPGVAEAAAIGIAHPKWDERPLLVVRARSRAATSARRQVRDYLAGHVAKWWLPDAIEFVDELPHTATGKLSKRTLREQFKDYRFADAEAMVGPRLAPSWTLRALPSPKRAAKSRLLKEVRDPMAAQYAFVMKDMTKSFPGAQKPVLSNINLQFYHGAKIGIVGPNGAGKSTLMKIMAGIDKEFTGEAWPGENITVGYLPQEPQLDPTKTVLENVKDGAREVADMVDRFNAISAEMGDPKDDTDFDALMEEMGELQEQDRRGRRLDARQPARGRDGGAALPARATGRSRTCRAARSAASR